MAYNLVTFASLFGVLSCLSIILDVYKMILDRSITKVKLSLYSFSLILILIVTIMLLYGFLNTPKPTSSFYDINKKPTINVINKNINTYEENNIFDQDLDNIIGNYKSNYSNSTFSNNRKSHKIFFGIMICFSITGNFLLIISKILSGKKIKIIFNGFEKNKDIDKNIVINDIIEIKTSYLTFYSKKIALNYFIYFDYAAILLVILFLSFGSMSYMIFFDSAIVQKTFLSNYLNKTIRTTNTTYLNWNIQNIASNNKLAIMLGFISSGIGLFLSFSIIINTFILNKSKLISKFNIFLKIFFAIIFFIICLVTILAYNNSGILIDIYENQLLVQGPEILTHQNKILSITSINWSYLNKIGNDIKIDNELLKGNYVIVLSILISLTSLSSILYIIYKIVSIKKNIYRKKIIITKKFKNI